MATMNISLPEQMKAWVEECVHSGRYSNSSDYVRDLIRRDHIKLEQLRQALIEGENSNLYDVLNSGESPNPDKSLLHESLKVEILRALETLTPREADVVKLYFGLGDAHPMTLEEIGETFDLTRERVRQIKEKAIRRLKHTSRSKILRTYLG